MSEDNKSLPELKVIPINEGDKEALGQATKNVLKKHPEVVLTTTGTAKPKEMPLIKHRGPIAKGNVIEVCSFESLKGNRVYITEAEIVGGTKKAIFKRGGILHNKILLYLLNHTHEQLEASGHFQVRDATEEEIKEFGASKDKPL